MSISENRTVVALTAPLLVAGLLAGCATDGEGGATTSPDPAPQASSASPSADAPPTRTDLPTQRRAARGTRLVFTDLDVSRGDGTDRVVLRMRGPGTPGWFVDARRKARQEGSGRLIRIAGDSVVDVHVEGTVWPARGYYDGPRRITPRGAGPVAQVYVGGTFEGWTQVVVGIDGTEPGPVKLRALQHPPRLVVQVAGTETR